MKTDTLPEFIFFDLDDTLLDDEVSTQVGVNALFEHYGSVDVEDRHQRWDAALQEYYPAFLAGNITVQQLQQSRIRYVLPDQTFTDIEALAAFEYFVVNYVEGATLFSDTRPLIARLKARRIEAKGSQRRRIAAKQNIPLKYFRKKGSIK